jgi:hypothetical protein
MAEDSSMRRCLTAGLLALTLAGCGKPGAVTTEYLGKVVAEAPPEMVRIVAAEVPADEHTAHWNWSLRGDRVWPRASVEPTDGGRVIHLADAYSLQSTDQKGGSGAWDIDLGVIAVDPDAESMGLKFILGVRPVGLKRTAHDFESQTGANAAINQSGTLAGAARATEPSTFIKSLVTGEQTLKLPVNLPIARIEWTDTDGSKQTHTITLKIDP